MQTLDVINAMFATMGERPVSSLASPHRYMNSAKAVLASTLESILAVGWWFNTETNVLAPTADNQIIVGGDVLNVRPPADKAQYVLRGGRLYDSSTGTYTVTESLTCEVVRLLTIEEVPTSVAQYIKAAAVLAFQSEFDGDSDRTRRLAERENSARILANADQTRYSQANMLETTRLLRLKSRYWRRPR